MKIKLRLGAKVTIFFLLCFKLSALRIIEPTPPPQNIIPSTELNIPAKSSANYCEAGQVHDYFFGKTPVNEIGLSSIKCEPSGRPLASVLCGLTENNQTKFLGDTFAKYDCEETLDEVLEVNQKNDSFSNLKLTIKKIQLRLTADQPLNLREASNIVKVLERVKNSAKAKKFSINAGTTLKYLVFTLSKISQVFNDTASIGSTVTKKRIAQLFPGFFLLSRFSESQRLLSMKNNILSAQIENHPLLANQNIAFTPEFKGDNNQSVTLFVPGTVLQNAIRYIAEGRSTASSLRTVFIAYKDDTLFPSNETALNILSVNVGLNPSANSNLKDPIIIRHTNLREKPEKRKLPNTKLTLNETVLRCVHWNFSTSSWSDNGCRLKYVDHVAECQCFHLTNFALLVSYRNVPADFALDLVSAIGCGLSIAGLLVTIMILGYQRELREHKPGKILLHLCCNLCISYIIFLSGVSSAVGNIVACSIVTFLLHYFLLVTWLWMGIYSYEMYIEVVKVFNIYCSKFMIKASVIAYGIPALIAGATIGSTLPFYSNQEEQYRENYNQFSGYFSTNVCWLTGYSLIFGFLLPCGVILLCNIVSFFAVIFELKRKKLSRSHPGRSKYSAKDLLLIAMTTTFLTGLTWTFGYLLVFTQDDSVFLVLSWLFAVSSAIQGFVIFLLTIIRRNKTRQMWWRSIKGIFHTESYYRDSYASSIGSSVHKAASLRSSASILKKDSRKT